MTDNKGTVLIVDDTPANLQLLESILQEKGYTVRAAISGHQRPYGAESRADSST